MYHPLSRQVETNGLSTEVDTISTKVDTVSTKNDNVSTGICSICNLRADVSKVRVASHKRLCVVCTIKHKLPMPNSTQFHNDIPCGVKTCDWTGAAKYTMSWDVCDKCNDAPMVILVHVEGVKCGLSTATTSSVKYVLDYLDVKNVEQFRVVVRDPKGDRLIPDLTWTFRNLNLRDRATIALVKRI